MATHIPKELRRREGNPLEIIVITVLLIGGILYGVTAMSTGNLTWFSRAAFATRPAQIEIYHEGNRTLLRPGNSDYESLTALFTEQMNQIAGYYEFSPRPEDVQTMKGDNTIVLLTYPDRLRINTAWNLGEPDQIMVPIAGPRSNANLAFTGHEERFGHGALILEDLTAFYAEVDRLLEAQ